MARVLIIGGGIAGPVAATALHKAGVEAAVYEAHPAPPDGAFLTLGVNGLAALRAVDLVDAVYAAGRPARRVEIFRPDGVVANSGPFGPPDDSGLVPQTLSRATLHKALTGEAIRRGISVEYGKRLVGAETGRAEFADGTYAEGDILIGADGINSVTRRLIDPDAPAPRYVGQHLLYGFCDHAPQSVPSDTYHALRTSKLTFGMVGGPAESVWWFARIFAEEIPRDEAAAKTADDWRDQLLSSLGDDRTPMARVVAATKNIGGHNGFDLPPVPKWYGDDMIIVGDAAHAASPSAAQGASMAAEDAVVLAKCLRDIPEISRAFQTYERLRRPRVQLVVDVSADLSRRPTDPRSASPTRANWLEDLRLDWQTPVS
ncbi:FAD-dependent monooxygenase [Fodinicola acaciae]|uniref:FAD-dependent monooxygenase n=1 Tax=Fodinicola acaciae TaxID=2681555 RepID=UPI0013D3E66B|nr:FAD-dependent monooxygenase [Fodinicola acaciae]